MCLILLVLLSCNSIKTGDQLSKDEILKIHKLGLLEKDEKVIAFSSQSSNIVSGNFYTDRRIASYWQDKHNSAENEANSAFYKDIISIDTVVYAGLTFAPFMTITKKDSTSFKAYFDGEKKSVRKLFKDVFEKWENTKRKDLNLK
jgi:hypothetical protein